MTVQEVKEKHLASTEQKLESVGLRYSTAYQPIMDIVRGSFEDGFTLGLMDRADRKFQKAVFMEMGEKQKMQYLMLCLAYAFDLQTVMVDKASGNSMFFQEVYKNFNNARNAVKKFIDSYFNKTNPGVKGYIDDMGCIIWEMSHNVIKSQDPRVLWSLVETFMEGLVYMDGDDVPLNEKDFKSTK